MEQIKLSSFGNELTAMVFGASGGIGNAFIKHLQSHDKVKKLIAVSRDENKIDNIDTLSFDLTDEASIANCFTTISEPIDLVLVATGLLHNCSMHPEKTWGQFEANTAHKSFQINTIGPMLIAKYALPKLNKNRKSVFAAISARVGSISDNHLGGWYSYRASKAALNQMICSASIELSRKNQAAFCVGLHPGTVDTDLSKPFQSRVHPDKLFSPSFSAASMLNVIDQLGPNDSGQLFAWDGSKIEP